MSGDRATPEPIRGSREVAAMPERSSRASGRARPTTIPRITPSNLLAFGRWLRLRARHRNIEAPLFFVAGGATWDIRATAEVRFGRRVRFSRDFTALFEGSVDIGDLVWFARGCTVVSYESVEIGEGCTFGEWVSIHDTDHDVASPGAARWDRITTAPVRIGSNVWAGAKATILRGVTVGDNATIAANAVVTEDVPARTVVAGVPARVVRELDA